MAADLNLEWICSLPRSWTYGITRGGRVFFINEEAKSTTWLHPVTGEAVVTGHRRQSTDLPTGWEEAYTFEGARYYINHNERKVTCKHPVTGQPSQDNCIFVVNDQAVGSMPAEDKKERPVSMVNEASYSPASDYAPHPMSPAGRTSRASKKVHNFGKRSNSIKRNPNAPVVRRGWLYKQDSTGMKLWKKRWFVLSDLCLFYYRDEKEEGILGSILLPSFQIAMLTSEDHIHRKYAFKAAHPNMRTYYFCTDTGKEMELWMKAMLDAALVHTEPVKRVDKIPSESAPPKETNNIPNHRLLVKPEAQNNQRNKDTSKLDDRKALEAEKYGFQMDGHERPLTKINSVKLTALPSDYDGGSVYPRPGTACTPDGRLANDLRAGGHPEPNRILQRTNSMLQLGQWIKIQKERSLEDEPRGVISYQTLPRNMPSHRAPMLARYPEGYRTLPRNPKARPDSLCSAAPSIHERPEEKRRSVRGDTMSQLYQWQQRQVCGKQATLPRPAAQPRPGPAEHASPPLALLHACSPQRSPRPGLSPPGPRGDATLDRRHRPHHPKHMYVPDRRSMPASLTLPSVSSQSLQGKTMKENEPVITMVHTMIENSALRPQLYQQLSQDGGALQRCRPDEADTDAKLSRLCEQDKVVRALEDRLWQLHKEKYTLEQALLSASQEIETNADNPAAIQTVLLQRDDLQNGLLSTCRELSRATAELERAWREYDKLEYDVTVTRKQMQEQLDRLGEVQTESAGIQRAQVQKEMWRIQDVMEGLSKHKQQRGSWEPGVTGSKPFSTVKYRSEGPDYRLYKSEPELTTVAEVDESNGEEKSEPVSEAETAAIKGPHFPVGIVPPRTKSPTPESSTIASYVTLRKTKKVLDLSTERPRSAVEQLCLAESSRPRMTVEEQMERIRRHQQACLRERKKGWNVLGASDPSPLHSPSSLRENPFRMVQPRRRDDGVKEPDAVSTESDGKPPRESPTEDALPVITTEPQSPDSGKELKRTENVLYGVLFAPEPKGLNSEESGDKERSEESDPVGVTCSPGDDGRITNHEALDSPEEDSKSSAPDQEEPAASREPTPEASRESQTPAVPSLTPSPEPSSPEPPLQTELPEGSHFMCV
ncbi:pleckstrin homology domain-containing family A member 5 isoform X2 [Dipodomys spectabilis]|uniref:pleckstrin homology domain-containing family A member 5 isoform X2 n=1 Tax=Dipodomys spectabilis TaxID=105255 RepID=UPI001C545C48|nr:pleckstrin homology domain-containing family A member 5 isoform X2 [Dipodomys spectabilis]